MACHGSGLVVAEVQSEGLLEVEAVDMEGEDHAEEAEEAEETPKLGLTKKQFLRVRPSYSLTQLQEVDEAVLVKESDVVVTCLKVARIFHCVKVHNVKLRSNLLLVYLILVPDQCL